MKKKSAPTSSIVLPRENAELIGHETAENAFLSSWKQRRLHHAWLLSGPKGMGKATLAYRMARFLLNNSSGESLDMPETSTLFQRIAHGNFSDLLVIERGDGKEITVDTVREVGQFLRLTPAESSSRIVIIDSADDMNINAANSLLKLLEEPPVGAFLFLISHQPASLLPTIRSRCRSLKLAPLAEETALKLLMRFTDLSVPEATKLLQITGNSPGRAMELYQYQSLPLYLSFLDILRTIPRLDMVALHKLGDQLAGKENMVEWEHFSLLLQRFCLIATKQSLAIGDALLPEEDAALQHLKPQIPLGKWLEIAENLPIVLQDTTRAHLDKKQALLVIAAMIQ